MGIQLVKKETQSLARTSEQSTPAVKPFQIISTPDGTQGVSIYANGKLFEDKDFNGVILALKANYPQLKENNADNNMFFSLLKAAAVRNGFTAARLKESVFDHISNSPYPPKVSDLMEFDRAIEVLSYKKVEMLSWPHDPIVKIFLPNGRFMFAYEKDVDESYGYKTEPYITPSQKEFMDLEEARKITPEQREEFINRILSKASGCIKSVNDVLS